MTSTANAAHFSLTGLKSKIKLVICGVDDTEEIVAVESTSDRNASAATSCVDDVNTRKVVCQVIEEQGSALSLSKIRKHGVVLQKAIARGNTNNYELFGEVYFTLLAQPAQQPAFMGVPNLERDATFC